MNSKKYLFTYDLREPWGISPFFFGAIQFIWGFITLLFEMVFALKGHGNFAIAILVALLPTEVLAVGRVRRSIKWGWLLTAITNMANANQMIVDSLPRYRTIFGYNQIKTAPSFDVFKLSNGNIELLVHANGCPNFDTEIPNGLIRELPNYSVDVSHAYPLTIVLRKKMLKGREYHDSDFI